MKHLFLLLAIAMALLFAMPVAAAPPGPDNPAALVGLNLGDIAPAALGIDSPAILASGTPLLGANYLVAIGSAPAFCFSAHTLAGPMYGVELPIYCASSSNIALDTYLTRTAHLIALARDQTFRA